MLDGLFTVDTWVTLNISDTLVPFGIWDILDTFGEKVRFGTYCNKYYGLDTVDTLVILNISDILVPF